MAIKKLQNDFTTPEQSKRLLELGVPADSADCVITIITEDIYAINLIPDHNVYSDIKDVLQIKRGKKILPCWSVGRLMQIFDICCDETNRFFGWEEYDGEYNYIGYIISRFIDNIMNFSKLED